MKNPPFLTAALLTKFAIESGGFLCWVRIMIKIMTPAMAAAIAKAPAAVAISDCRTKSRERVTF